MPQLLPSSRSPLSSWTSSVVLGTFAGAWVYATARTLYAPGDLFLKYQVASLAHPVLGQWLLLMAYCSALAALLIVVRATVDVTLLRLGVPLLHGPLAWMAAVIGTVGTLECLRPALLTLLVFLDLPAIHVAFAALFVVLLPTLFRVELHAIDGIYSYCERRNASRRPTALAGAGGPG